MKDALAIHRALLTHERPHEIVRLPHAVASADELPEALRQPPGRCLAVRAFSVRGPVRAAMPGQVPARRDSRPGVLVAVVVTAGFHPPAAAVRAVTGARQAVPAPARMVNAVTDYAAPLIAPLLLPDGVPVLLDRTAADGLDPGEVVYTATGEPRTALGIRMGDLLALSGAIPVELRGPYAPREPREPRAAVPGPRRALAGRVVPPRRVRGQNRAAAAARRERAPRQVDQGE